MFYFHLPISPIFRVKKDPIVVQVNFTIGRRNTMGNLFETLENEYCHIKLSDRFLQRHMNKGSVVMGQIEL